MSTELTPFEKPEYGNLVKLPSKVAQWNMDATKMKAIAEAFKAETDTLDIARHEDLPAIDKRLENAILKIRGMFERINGERMAETSYLDEIKAYTMRPEKMLADYPAIFKGVRDKIAAERARRDALKKQEEADRIANSNELAEIKVNIKLSIDRKAGQVVHDTVLALNNSFYDQTLETIDEAAKKLASWSFSLKKEKCFPEVAKTPLISVPELNEWSSKLFDEYFPSVANLAQSTINDERDRIITLIPSRKRELQEIKDGNAEAEKQAAERKQQEDKKREDDAAAAALNSAQAAESALEIEKLNNAFTTAEPTQSQSKGTQVKKKYQPLTAAAFLPIIQSWVKNDLAGYTVEDLTKKLSFMLTASNARLNKGEKLEAKDLNIVEDYSTRTVKEKDKL